MTGLSSSPVPGHDALVAAFEAQRAAARAQPFPDRATRRRHLRALESLVKDERERFAEAISADFGHRSRHETLVADVYVVLACIRHVRRKFGSWMKPRRVTVTLPLQPASAKVFPQPLGVVGIMSPWNYPIQLALIPLAYALAAGNRAVIKPSEFTPRTTALLKELLGRVFDEDTVAVVEGDAELGAVFAGLPFDHLFFTGSTRVGRLVMASAAANLTPVTLELGGKSPFLLHPSFPTDRAASSLVAGKLFNAGQTCIAPDYVLVHKDQADALEAAFLAEVARTYPNLGTNPDYTSIVTDRHFARLTALVEDAEAKGAKAVRAKLEGGHERTFPPVLLRGVTAEMDVMQEEIFGPVLPVVEVDDYEAALTYINERPRPLALYIFDQNGSRVDAVLARTHAGSVCVNDTLLQAAEEHLPFGGVGDSGMGAYHGRVGFDRLSHLKPVFHQSKINGRAFLSAPYGAFVDRLLKFLI